MACHLRVQNIGLKTRDLLKLVPDTTVDVIERCSGHNGTYAVKKEFRPASMKIGQPVMSRVEAPGPTTTPATARWPATRSSPAYQATRSPRIRSSCCGWPTGSDFQEPFRN